jgi:2-succinyl-6-hydroxy-2,4-cyclohexadiene-1-carboxylate synthase
MTGIATRNGGMWVRSHGTGPSRVVALHGFSLHGGMWATIARELGESVIAPDLPGHGRTTIEPVTMRTAVDAVTELLSGLDKPVLLGYSQGGRVALQVALAQPSLIGALVVVSTSPGLSGRARMLREAADAGLASRIERIGIVRFIDEWLANPLVAPVRADADARDADRELRLENSAAGIAAALRGLGHASVADVSDRLPELSMPTEFVAGELDTKYTEFATAMAKSIGQRPVIVPDVGHNIVLEAPQAVAAVVRELLRTS